eukprot:9140721-Alexandrium_andersonii.AAC.1
MPPPRSQAQTLGNIAALAREKAAPVQNAGDLGKTSRPDGAIASSSKNAEGLLRNPDNTAAKSHAKQSSNSAQRSSKSAGSAEDADNA